MAEAATRKIEAKEAATVIEPQRVMELGNGLELWKVHPSSLREQDVNARAMPKAMFERLAQTIGRDKRLESLPLCAKTDRGIEIISGHHRTRAATSAGVEASYRELHSTKGHDAFLVEWEQLGAILTEALEGIALTA